MKKLLASAALATASIVGVAGATGTASAEASTPGSPIVTVNDLTTTTTTPPGLTSNPLGFGGGAIVVTDPGTPPPATPDIISGPSSAPHVGPPASGSTTNGTGGPVGPAGMTILDRAYDPSSPAILTDLYLELQRRLFAIYGGQ